MPPTRKVPLVVVTSTAYSFGNGSVVMIARAAAAPPSAASAFTACGMPARILSILRLTPITPVEATSTWSSGQPTVAAVSLRHFVRIGHALRARARVGAAAVGDDRFRAAAARREVVLAEIDRRRLREIDREHAGGGRRSVADDQRQIRLAAGLDSAVEPAGAKTGRRGHAALDRAKVQTMVRTRSCDGSSSMRRSHVGSTRSTAATRERVEPPATIAY